MCSVVLFATSAAGDGRQVLEGQRAVERLTRGECGVVRAVGVPPARQGVFTQWRCVQELTTVHCNLTGCTKVKTLL
jgi:hypothetical protein